MMPSAPETALPASKRHTLSYRSTLLIETLDKTAGNDG